MPRSATQRPRRRPFADRVGRRWDRERPDSGKFSARRLTFYFEYGTTSGHGHRTPAQAAVSSTQPVPVTAPVAGSAAAATTYHYSVVAL